MRHVYNRHRIGRALADVLSSFELIEFEQFEATPGTALLRVSARAPAGALGGLPKLVIGDGKRRHRFPPLPAPPDAGGLLRAAFSAPAELISARATFSLELPDGSV